jgi:hypothetical protein
LVYTGYWYFQDLVYTGFTLCRITGSCIV